jgi:ribosome-binding ATPase YchF (GTP1/OBG family)
MASDSEKTLSELLKDFGKDVVFCFVPVPGSQFNKISKVAKTSKAIVEAAKVAGIVKGAAAGASN